MTAKRIVAFIIVIFLALLPLTACKGGSEIADFSARLEGKTVVWNECDGAVGYMIRCTLTDGTGYSLRTSELSYTPPRSTVGDHMYVIEAVNGSGAVIARSEPVLYHLGAGSAEDPILIASAEELLEITGSTTVYFGDVKVSAPLYYRLTADVDLGNAEVAPIGNESTPFGGVFDGDGHKITGLAFTNCNKDAKIGLFGDVREAVIKNLTLEDATMTFDENSNVKNSDLRFGLLVGSAVSTYIDNCHVSGRMEALVPTTDSNKMSIGGVVGTITSGSITNCSFRGEISAQYGTVYAGGIVGESKTGDPYFFMANCSSDATVWGKGMMAYDVTNGVSKTYVRVGVVGGNVPTQGRISSILATGSATAEARDGTSASSRTAGVFGRTLMSGNESSTPLYHIYYDESISKVSAAATTLGTFGSNVHPLSAEALRSRDSYLEGETYGLDLDGAWRMTEGELPTLAGTGSLVEAPSLTLLIRGEKLSYDVELNSTFLPTYNPITLERTEEYHVGYHLDDVLSSLNVLSAMGIKSEQRPNTRVVFSAEGLEDVTVTIGASNKLPYLIYALCAAPELPSTAYGGYKIVDDASLVTYDFTSAKRITVTIIPPETQAE